MDTIQPEELARRLKDEESIQLIDVREQDEWDHCRIEGAKLVPLSEFTETAEQEIGKEGPIVVYCHHGMRSEQAGMFLLSRGYEGVLNLVGGIDAWSLQVDESVPRY